MVGGVTQKRPASDSPYTFTALSKLNGQADQPKDFQWLEKSIPGDLHRRTRIVVRNEFFGDGYAKSTPQTDAAIATAHDELGLALEVTYTGKAMAALLHDAGQERYRDDSMMFWNTYNSNPLPEIRPSAIDTEQLPGEFLRYFD